MVKSSRWGLMWRLVNSHTYECIECDECGECDDCDE